MIPHLSTNLARRDLISECGMGSDACRRGMAVCTCHVSRTTIYALQHPATPGQSPHDSRFCSDWHTPPKAYTTPSIPNHSQPSYACYQNISIHHLLNGYSPFQGHISVCAAPILVPTPPKPLCPPPPHNTQNTSPLGATSSAQTHKYSPLASRQ